MKLEKNRYLNYKCYWCYETFQESPNEWSGQTQADGSGGKHKGSGSTIIVCPTCKRTIPTWGKKLTGEVVGQKHIHIKSWKNNEYLFGTEIRKMTK